MADVSFASQFLKVACLSRRIFSRSPFFISARKFPKHLANRRGHRHVVTSAKVLIQR
jgi:hypothetical protein